MKTLLLFDIDSTLLRADDATRVAMSGAFQDIFGVRDATAGISFSGRTDPEILQESALSALGRLLQDEEFQRLIERYVYLLPRELERSESFQLMPGVKQLLTSLTAMTDVVLGIETGNLEAGAGLKLKRGGIESFFSVGGFGSDSTNRTEIVRLAIARARKLHQDNIPKENIFIIGDAPQDIIAGRNLGINTMAVCTGHADRNTLVAESPKCILPDLSDIPLFMQYTGL